MESDCVSIMGDQNFGSCLAWRGKRGVQVLCSQRKYIGCNFVPKFGALTGCSRLVAIFTSEAQVRSQTCPYEVCGGRSGTGQVFLWSTCVVPRQHDDVSAPCWFIPVSRVRDSVVKYDFFSKIWGGIYSKVLCSCLLVELCAVRTESCKFRSCNTFLLLAFHTMHWRLHRIDLVLL
jgi:hypothetical protein